MIRYFCFKGQAPILTSANWEKLGLSASGGLGKVHHWTRSLRGKIPEFEKSLVACRSSRGSSEPPRRPTLPEIPEIGPII